MATTDEAQTAVVAPDGDVRLVIGRSSKVTLLISSIKLAKASKVFAALLGPNFREGQGLSDPRNPKEIELPDDDAEAMLDMCHLLHGSYVADFCKSPNASRLLTFAITVDKYGCAYALRVQSQAALLASLVSDDRPEVLRDGQLMTAAYLLDNAQAFKVATKRLIGGVTSEYQELLRHQWSCHVPMGVLYGMEARRTAIQGTIVQGLRHLGRPGSACSTCKVIDSELVSSLCDHFGTSFWPPSFMYSYDKSTDRCLEIMKGLGSVTVMSKCSHWTKSAFTRGVAQLMENLKPMCDGMCLFCVKEGQPDLKSKCRIQLHLDA